MSATEAGTDVVRVDLGDRSYDIVIGPDAPKRLVDVVAARRRVAIVTQAVLAGVASDHAARLSAAGVVPDIVTIDDGEEAKSLATVEVLCRAFARGGLLRGDAVVALGGGVVGDTAGFAAAVYHRGIAVVQVPTTLLAMVDSAIGGKTAVNLAEGKNLVGAFHQPVAVLADPAVLATLSDREYRCGLGEVVKYALMGDDALLARCRDDVAALVRRDPAVLRDVITRSAAIKARYVSVDEHETAGMRAHLNYGHTLAHAVETLTAAAGGTPLAHGEAVAVGLVFAGALGGALECIPRQVADAHRELVAGLGLPTTVPPGLRRADLEAVMRRDKKAAGGLTFVLRDGDRLVRVDDPAPAALDAAFAAVGVRD